MDIGLSLLTLLHILIPVYWLGGDLGAFYGSRFMVDPKRSVAERMMALKILNNIDMAPRTTLILAFPTGFGLAVAKGWLDLPASWAILAGVLGLAWLALAWTVHLKHGPQGQAFKRFDILVRYIVLAGLAAAVILGLSGEIALPLFITLKMLALGACITLGLVVRRQLVPLFPAIVQMRESGPTPETDRVIAAVNGRARISVLTIWVLVLIACFLGIATPL
ncbi:hypothetical protein ACLIMP_19600 [Novosphingobium aerophilum]|uniref:hypothetical protein n=1 Tax=Novosphingobium TaxID=165696 RepID=UPI0006C8B7EC|nr:MULTISPECIES: hypothetical protein [unclassified Novosphingobium]KPH58144.1 hypothetical protein ADT71_27065 [Novosphingobium sp. ST904]MPS67953.1 hypothetical protein [Novosphingobium sp.]TCM41377.1 hypothetical protein EDF59_103127 [Novosphingobium sp. ST904]